jgi:hypothetical protein
MHDRRDRERTMTGATLVAIVVALVLAFAALVAGPWNTGHVASNAGPSGTPGSTAIDKTPPPADSPSDNTTGAAR